MEKVAFSFLEYNYRFLKTKGMWAGPTFLAVIFLLSGMHLRAQDETLRHWNLLGLTSYEAAAYDSALFYFSEAKKHIESRKLQHESLSPLTYTYLGHCYRITSKPVDAHKSYTEALKLARKNEQFEDRIEAFSGLNQLHWQITLEDWSFPYSGGLETIIEPVFFPIEKVVPYKGDSVLVFVYGGINDGIRDSLLRADLYRSRANRGDNEKTLAALGKAVVKELTPNRTVLALQIFDTSEIPKPNDLARIFTHTPLSIVNGKYYGYLKNSINFQNNYRARILSRRYLYYYADSLINSDVILSMKMAIMEIVNQLQEDSLSFPVLRNPLPDGIYTGISSLEVMEKAETKEINHFLDYVKERPAIYMGGAYSFAETFATWLINAAPLSEEGILNEVVLEYLNKASTNYCKKLNSQIESQELVKAWLDKGMEAVTVEKFTDQLLYVFALNYYGSCMQNDTAKAWGNFLLGISDFSSNNVVSGEAYIKTAENLFKKISLEEGVLLCKAARKKYNSQSGVALHVQTGHFGAYRVAMAPYSKHFATAGDDYLVKIWDADLGKEFRTLNLHTDEVNGICYSADGRLLYSGGDDSIIVVWSTFSYDTIRVLRPGFPIRHLSVSNNGSRLAVTGYDSTIKIIDSESGTIIREIRKHTSQVNGAIFLPNSNNFIFSYGNDSLIYKWNIDDGNYTRWFKEKGRVLSLALSPDGRFMVSASTDEAINVWDISNYTFKYKLKNDTYEMLSGSKFFSDPSISPDSKLLVYASPERKICYFELETGQYVNIRPVRTGFPEQFHFIANGQALFIHYPFENAIVKSDLSGFNDFFANPKPPPSAIIYNYYNPTVTLDFSQDGRELYVLATDVTSFDLTNGTSTKLGYAPQKIWNEKFIWKSKQYFAEVNDKRGVFITARPKEGSDTIASFHPDGMTQLEAIAWSPDSETSYLAGDGNRLAAYHFGKQSLLYNRTINSVGKFEFLYADSVANRLYAIVKEKGKGVIQVFSLADGRWINAIREVDALKLWPANNRLYILGNNDALYRIHASDGKIEKKWGPFQKINPLEGGFFAVAPNEKFAVVQSDGNHICIVDLISGKVTGPIYDHDFAGTDIRISPDSKLIATAGFDSRIHFYDPVTGSRLLNVYTPLNEALVLADTAGNYLATKKALNTLVFTLNDKPYDFEQFDMYLNRPDLILQKLPHADSATINTFKAAWQKRVQRAGLSEFDAFSINALPVITLRDKSSETFSTQKNEIQLFFECTGGDGLLETLQVTVNNNPVFAGKGKSLPALKSLRDSVMVPLAYGRNVVRYYCLNDKGISSLRESLVITSNARERKSITHFVGIAVSSYKDERMDLEYPVKDVRDLLLTFSKGTDSLLVDTLFDNKATNKNIRAVKERLKNLQPGDKLIVAVAGHGLLDKKFDFYYATYDCDFDDPTAKGLKYEELEGLTEGIAAQRKLMLIDACHSGALDKEELSEGNVVRVEGNSSDSGTVTGKRGIKLPPLPSRPPPVKVFDLMQSQFTDLANNNGTVIISAAGGMEFAFESPEWNNGVFTYCIRQAIESKFADYSVHGNLDGRVSVMELLNYVNQRVSDLTHGKQKPVSRRENVSFDWIITE